MKSFIEDQRANLNRLAVRSVGRGVRASRIEISYYSLEKLEKTYSSNAVCGVSVATLPSCLESKLVSRQVGC